MTRIMIALAYKLELDSEGPGRRGRGRPGAEARAARRPSQFPGSRRCSAGAPRGSGPLSLTRTGGPAEARRLRLGQVKVSGRPAARGHRSLV
jgi:hypothetical protein